MTKFILTFVFKKTSQLMLSYSRLFVIFSLFPFMLSAWEINILNNDDGARYQLSMNDRGVRFWRSAPPTSEHLRSVFEHIASQAVFYLNDGSKENSDLLLGTGLGVATLFSTQRTIRVTIDGTGYCFTLRMPDSPYNPVSHRSSFAGGASEY